MNIISKFTILFLSMTFIISCGRDENKEDEESNEGNIETSNKINKNTPSAKIEQSDNSLKKSKNASERLIAPEEINRQNKPTLKGINRQNQVNTNTENENTENENTENENTENENTEIINVGDIKNIKDIAGDNLKKVSYSQLFTIYKKINNNKKATAEQKRLVLEKLEAGGKLTKGPFKGQTVKWDGKDNVFILENKNQIIPLSDSYKDTKVENFINDFKSKNNYENFSIAPRENRFSEVERVHTEDKNNLYETKNFPKVFWVTLKDNHEGGVTRYSYKSQLANKFFKLGYLVIAPNLNVLEGKLSKPKHSTSFIVIHPKLHKTRKYLINNLLKPYEGKNVYTIDKTFENYLIRGFAIQNAYLYFLGTDSAREAYVGKPVHFSNTYRDSQDIDEDPYKVIDKLKKNLEEEYKYVVNGVEPQKK